MFPNVLELDLFDAVLRLLSSTIRYKVSLSTNTQQLSNEEMRSKETTKKQRQVHRKVQRNEADKRSDGRIGKFGGQSAGTWNRNMNKKYQN